MTAIDGSTFDLFDDLGLGADGDGAARAALTRRFAVFVTAGALLVGGAVAARAAIEAGPAPAELVAPASLVGVLGQPQRAADVLVEEPATAALDPATTRYLGETAAGRHFVAQSTAGLVCLVTVPVGDVADVGCADPVATAVLVEGQFARSEAVTVRLVPDGTVPEPDGVAAWQRVGANLWAHPGVALRS
ncbi:hypothetical protein [Cellulomonas cellasea]|uniref:Uncharacterized protein n=1 Tax=Cellulomonas cellasea TaxID=43670 RepID=A0A7W4UIX3_9CELL|nr:hypothetical protein [Cellulomonas cellasea]MBB2924664.1 hypothetical protein [Cellulomonas cellasea]